MDCGLKLKSLIFINGFEFSINSFTFRIPLNILAEKRGSGNIPITTDTTTSDRRDDRPDPEHL